MKRGIVMSIHENHAVVMTPDGQFLQAPLQGSPAIGQELLFEEETGLDAPPRRSMRMGRTHLMRYVGSAAAVLLVVAACFIYAAARANPVVAYVTMDINPSIEIGVDDREKVRQLRAMNEAGSRLIDGIDYKGQPVETVATRILEKASNAHYLDAPHKDILIASILMNGSKAQYEEFERLLAQSLDDELSNWLAEHNNLASSVTITTLFVPVELRSEADAIGISAGKMALYLMAKDEGYTIEMDSLKQHSIDKATASIGGVGQILGDAEDPATKAKLEQLLKQEQESKSGASAKPSAEPKGTAKPTQKPSSKPSEKPAAKPTAKPTAKTAKPAGKPTKKPDGKPSATAKPGWGERGSWGDWDDWKAWNEQWKHEWNEEELEKLKKEWEKAGKDWRKQWEKWEQEQKSRDRGKENDKKGSSQDQDKSKDDDDDDKKRVGWNGNVSWNAGDDQDGEKNERKSNGKSDGGKDNDRDKRRGNDRSDGDDDRNDGKDDRKREGR